MALPLQVVQAQQVLEPLRALDQVRATAIDLGMKFGPKLLVAIVILVAGFMVGRWAARQIRDEFQPATWDAFWRTAVEGQDAAEVARELQKNTGAIYAAKSRVMRRLREKIEADPGRPSRLVTVFGVGYRWDPANPSEGDPHGG